MIPTVGELIKELQKFPQDSRVVINNDSTALFDEQCRSISHLIEKTIIPPFSDSALSVVEILGKNL